MHEIFTTKRIDRIFFQSSRSCVKKFEQCHKSSTDFGKPLLVYIEPLGQIDNAQGQIQCSNTGTLFPRQNLSPSWYFLIFRKFLCQFFQCTSIKGLFFKHVAFFWLLHGLTGYACRINRRLLLLCFIHTRHYCYILMQLFPAWNLKDLKVDNGWPCLREC